jgi:hypothetical protein
MENRRGDRRMDISIDVWFDIDTIAMNDLYPYYQYATQYQSIPSWNILYEKAKVTVEEWINKNIHGISDEFLKEYVLRRKRTKRRWINDTKEQAQQEIEVVAKGLYEQIKALPDKNEKFKEIYGVETLELLPIHIEQQVTEWMKNNETYLVQFHYLRFLSATIIEHGFIDDFVLIMTKRIQMEMPAHRQRIIMSMPNSLSHFPFGRSSRVEVSQQVVIDESSYLVDQYEIDENMLLETKFNLDNLPKDLVWKMERALTPLDIRVFVHCLSYRSERFFSTGELYVDIGDIVRNIFQSDNANNYRKVRESLHRLANVKIEIINKDGGGVTTHVFVTTQIPIEKPNHYRETARIVISDMIVNEFIENRTINVYQNSLLQLKLDSTRVGIFPLQRERLRLATNQLLGEPLSFHANLIFFRHVLRFPNKRRKDNLSVIERMLNELLEKQLLVKSYQRMGDEFFIEFLPVSEQEAKDLMSGKANSAINWSGKLSVLSGNTSQQVLTI